MIFNTDKFMKKLSKHIIIKVLILFMFFSCGRTGQRNANNLVAIKDIIAVNPIVTEEKDDTYLVFAENTIAINQIVSEDSIQITNAIRLNEMKIDTIINEYQIIYRIVNNGRVFPLHDTIYADRSLILTIKKDNVLILNEKVFDKKDFDSIIESHFLDDIWLRNGGITDVSSEYVKVLVRATLPETGLSYFIWLMVYNDGQITMSGEKIDV